MVDSQAQGVALILDLPVMLHCYYILWNLHQLPPPPSTYISEGMMGTANKVHSASGELRLR